MNSLFLLQNCHAATKVAEMAGRHMPHMRFLGTNCWDVQITLIICATIVAIAIIVAIILAILYFKKKLDTQALEKKNKELEEKQEKGNTYSETEKTKKIQEELDNTKKELTKLKESPSYQTNQVYALFKEICGLSKDKDGVVDTEVADKLFELYQKVNSSEPDSRNKSSQPDQPTT